MKKLKVFIISYIYSAASCVYLFAAGFLFAKNRPLIFSISRHFGYDGKPFDILMPTVRLSQLVTEDVAVKMRELEGEAGNVSLYELLAINQLVKLHDPKGLFEIGTFNGRTTLNMASNCSQEAEVYTLDLPKDQLNSTRLSIASGDRPFILKERSGARYSGQEAEEKITQLYGDSATFDFSPFLNKIDFIFIDGAHSYEYVLNDSKTALELLRNGKGVILWHDFNAWKGVTRALNELYSENGKFKGLKHIEGTSLAYAMLE